MRRQILAGLFAASLCAGCGAQHHQRPAHHAALAPVATAKAPIPPRHRRHHRRPNPGRLPQTRARPSSSTRQFHEEMADLWQGIKRDRPALAMPAFFPEAAYVQVKAIADPQADWHSRLVGGYAADIAAAHALVGRGARLIAVEVPAGYAHWVPPGTCYNRIGYWETPNSRVVYRQQGGVRSFGIASLISWRGVWYIVHLGAVLRTGTSGVVDDPSAGPGYSAPSSTC